MNKEDKLILGTLAGVDLVLSPEHYEEYKDTLNKQLEQRDKEIDRLNNIINQIENFINNEIFISLSKKNVFNEEADMLYKVLDKIKELKEDNNV